MGMNLDSGKKGPKVRPTINVTPLVDVVLVLLIIFMVVTPLMNKQMSVNVPVKSENDTPPDEQDSEPQVVLTVSPDGRAMINAEEIADAELSDKLKRIFAARQDKTLFFDAADGLDYGRAVEVLDIARGAGMKTIAVLTEAIAMGESN